MRDARRLLLITLHYPPAYGSGVQRMLAFTRDLPALGWEVDVLTIASGALPEVAQGRVADIPATTRVLRAPGLDSARHLAIRGRYLRRLSLPDRWISWRPGAVLQGWRYIRHARPRALLSSFPIATAHVVAADLARLTGLPWVADFRDPMAQDEYPKDPAEWASYRRVEERTVRHAAALTFTTPGARDYYLARYGESIAARTHIVANGYEEEVFAGLPPPPPRQHGGALTLLHSGLLYPWERNPIPFLHALAALQQTGFWRAHPTRFVFRGSGHDDHFLGIVAQLSLGALVEFLPRIDYRSALSEMLAADALLLFQARNSNFQIPAKAYEYLRAGRPLLAVVDPAGDSATLMRDHAHSAVVDIESEVAIQRCLESFIPRLAAGGFPPADYATVARHSRQAAAAGLARILDAASSEVR